MAEDKENQQFKKIISKKFKGKDPKIPNIKLPGLLGKAISMSSDAIAQKYTGKTIFNLFKQAANKKKELGNSFKNVNKLFAIAKNKRLNKIIQDDADDFMKSKTGGAEAFQEPYKKNISIRKSGGKVKKMQSGGRVCAPKGTGAALRGFGKGYK